MNLNLTIFAPGQLWKYTHDKKLINHGDESSGSLLNKYWTLPEENAEGYIEASDKVLGIKNSTVCLSQSQDVRLEARIVAISEKQKWHRGTANENGWFLLTNPHSGKVLTDYFDCLNIQGNYAIDY